MLTGLAGPDAWIETPYGPRRLPKLDLLIRQKDFRLLRWIEQLTTPLEMMQQALGQHMSRSSFDALELVAFGAHATAATLKLADQEMRNRSLSHNIEMLTRPLQPGASTLLADLDRDPLVARLEAIRHPSFLITAVDGSHLKSLVEDCHLRSAIVVSPKLGLEREGSETTRVMKILTSLLDGIAPKPPAQGVRGRDPNLLARAHAILVLTEAETARLHAMDAVDVNRFLWLEEGDPSARKPGRNDSGVFPELYQRASMEILSLRRDGQRLLMRFETKPSAARFEDELAAYELEVDPEVGSAGPWARGLPVNLFWALGFLCRSLPLRLQPDEESLMQASFAAARRLLKNHNDQVLRITRAALVEDRWRVARRIVEQLPIAETPGSFRDIVRYFGVQKKERIAPVTDALIEFGVLVINEVGIHQLGSVDLADVEDILNQRFAQP